MHASYVALPVALAIILTVAIVGFTFWDSGVRVEDLRDTENNFNVRRCSMICRESCRGIDSSRQAEQCITECQSLCAEAY